MDDLWLVEDKVSMGNISKGTLNAVPSAAYNPSLSTWSVLERGNQYTLWRDPLTHDEIQEYKFMLNGAEEFQEEKVAFEVRFNNDNLVASRYFLDETEKEFCSSYYKGSVFLQRVPLTLASIGELDLPDVLHVYSQCFKGFAELYDTVGYFAIVEDMIAINNDAVVKVWLNKNYGRVVPAPVYVAGTEREMVLKIIKTISNRTAKATSPSIADVLVRSNPYTFQDAFCVLESIALKLNVDIPHYLESAALKMRRNHVRRDSLVSEVNPSSPLTYSPIPELQDPTFSRQVTGLKRAESTKISMTPNTKKESFEKKMAVRFDPKYQQINYNLARSSGISSAFQEFSRISRISTLQDKRIDHWQHLAQAATSPPSRPATQLPPTTFQKTKSFTKQKPSVQFVLPENSYENKPSGYDFAIKKVPASSVKHLPIIREHNISESSLNESKPSFKIHFSDHHRLAEDYLNSLKSQKTQPSAPIIAPPVPLFTLNQGLSIYGESQVSKYSFNEPPHHNETINGLSNIKHDYYKPSSQSYYQSGKASMISNRHPIISQTPNGVVYKEAEQQPTFLSQASGVYPTPLSLSNIEQASERAIDIRCPSRHSSIYFQSKDASSSSLQHPVRRKW